MHQVTHDERGTAYRYFHVLHAMGVDSAGKTGSAEVGGRKKTHSVYCGFCPYDEPVLAYSLIIENAGHGSEAAVPIMADILSMVYQNNKLCKELGIKKKRYFLPEDELPGPDEDYREIPEEPGEEQQGEEPVHILID